MALPLYLAMTGAEFCAADKLPSKTAWMACHFSPYGTGLSNLPGALPEGSMLILNDRTPIHGHDPRLVASQLKECAEKRKAACVLLDFQRLGCAGTSAIAEAVVNGLSCPVGVSEPYAGGLDCPVFLPPTPPDTPLSDYLSPWRGREVWLEAALTCDTITITPDGASRASAFPPPSLPHLDPTLHCRYAITLGDGAAQFTLCRTADTLPGLLEEAESLGVTQAVGLFQELGRTPSLGTAET